MSHTPFPHISECNSFQIEHDPNDVIIIVGHSHYFRSMFHSYLHPAVHRRSSELARQLCTETMPTCAVACCELDFSKGISPICRTPFWPYLTIELPQTKESKRKQSATPILAISRDPILPICHIESLIKKAFRSSPHATLPACHTPHMPHSPILSPYVTGIYFRVVELTTPLYEVLYEVLSEVFI